jgi:hypothetical protein
MVEEISWEKITPQTPNEKYTKKNIFIVTFKKIAMKRRTANFIAFRVILR